MFPDRRLPRRGAYVLPAVPPVWPGGDGGRVLRDTELVDRALGPRTRGDLGLDALLSGQGTRIYLELVYNSSQEVKDTFWSHGSPSEKPGNELDCGYAHLANGQLLWKDVVCG